MVNVYLDTDCIIALVKENDWLKTAVKNRLKKEKKLCTSVITVIECRLVLTRENTIEEALSVEKIISRYKIKLLPLNEKILAKSKHLIKKFEFLGTFDSLHAATALLYKEKILSTDHVFLLISKLDVEDPRE